MSHHDVDSFAPTEWRDRLNALLVDRMNVPFAWGTNDCCMFAADAALAVTGIDFASAERGTYATASSAVALIYVLGGLSEIAGRAGVSVPVYAAMIGDIGLVVLDDRQMLAVCAGTCWMAPSATGLTGLELSAATAVWRLAHG